MDNDFKKLDEMKTFRYSADLYLTIYTLGYKYVSELVFDLYFNRLESTRVIADMLGLAQNSVLSWMRRWEFKRRRKGGNNRNPALKNPATIKKIADLKGKMNSRVAADTLGYCTSMTVRKIWRDC